jgi:predicted O-methyltransferase YrrM/tetratricopeptide (TPR) repeat protein
MATIILNKFEYNVLASEFTEIKHKEYNYLRIIENLGYYERIVSLLTGISKLGIQTAVFYNTTHGGFIPIQSAPSFKKTYLVETDLIHKRKILENMDRHNNIDTDIQFMTPSHETLCESILFSEDASYINISTSRPFILTTHSTTLAKSYRHIFRLSNTDLCLYVPDHLYDKWHQEFRYFLDAGGVVAVGELPQLTYDNLINLCIMVKNAGPQFEEMLMANMHLIDEWTILDTGSTDETLDIIQRLLVGKKRGALYQKPFINFRDSRNRLLELAGKSCKYTLMLDDTYVIHQYGTSYSLYIKSDDVEYASNRILKSEEGLKYLFKIHEVIQFENNTNVIIPIHVANIFDGRFEYMEERTMGRKQLDLKLLFEELEDDPDNPRTYYYLGQTYNLLEQYDKAYHYFLERANHPVEGFLQEKIDAVFEAARAANFKLDRPWPECEALYKRAYELDKTRPDAIYFLGIHYYLEGGSENRKRAYEYFKQGFEIGYPIHCQYSLKPTLSFHFLPKFLTQLCYEYENYKLGEKSAKLFLDNNPPTADMYDVMDSWHKLFVCMNLYLAVDVSDVTFDVGSHKPVLCFVADGGFTEWSGSSILTTGVGGSETYIIEMARHIQRQGHFQVVVFCKCGKEEIFEGVHYYHLNWYFEFIKTRQVHTCIISRFSEYYPATLLSNVENVYMVAHDLTMSGLVIPTHPKLRKIFCLTEWHATYFESVFPILKEYLVPFYYGIDAAKFDVLGEGGDKVKNRFIYSSFPDRGLLQVLTMWPEIVAAYPDASLHIYVDLENEWVNRVQPEIMKEVKQRLSDLTTKSGGSGVANHGWVSKSVLSQAWKRAEYWLYPCTFQETFCLTALEAAISKTVVISNDLAALQNTVGDRGLVIPGDATTAEWRSEAVKQVLRLMSSEGSATRAENVRRNYEWAAKLSWENRAKALLEDYLLPTQPSAPSETLQYVGMYNWAHDLPVGQNSKARFEKVIWNFNTTHVDTAHPPRILEVGTYAGTSLIEMVNRIPGSLGIGVDRWENYDEDKIDILQNIDSNRVEKVFYENIKAVGMEDRIRGIKGNSHDVLCEFIRKGEMFDFIYVDGSHRCLDVCLDLFLSWQCLNKGGVLAIDDYMYRYDRVKDMPYEYPFEAVNDFLKKYDSEYVLLDKNYRVFLEKR